jgi:hypothetical protein
MAESNRPHKTLFHISDDPNVRRFAPRSSAYTGDPVVWAVDEERLRNYLLPRDCPRVTFYAGPNTSVSDVQRFLGSSRSVVAFETGWIDRVQSTKLFCYHLPAHGFFCIDECAGYFVNRDAVTPQRVEVVEHLLYALKARNVEVRVLPSLWQLHDAVAQSTLQFSAIRMRNAAPRETP